jgi:uncharacterized ion transporter superfamily protein YfcC
LPRLWVCGLLAGYGYIFLHVFTLQNPKKNSACKFEIERKKVVYAKKKRRLEKRRIKTLKEPSITTIFIIYFLIMLSWVTI